MAYGKPDLDVELQQMICLGSMYDKLWAKFFNGSEDMALDDTLWPKVKVLKRMLQNEGVQFDSQYKRLDYGASYVGLDRLSKQYDLLHAEWVEKILQNIHPAFRPGFKLEDVPARPMDPIWVLKRDYQGEDQHIREISCRSVDLPTGDEEQSSLHHKPGSAVSKTHTECQLPLEPSVSARNMVDGADLDTVPPSQHRRPKIGSISLPRQSQSCQVATATSVYMSDPSAETRNVDFTREAGEITQTTQGRSGEQEGDVATLLDNGQRLDLYQELMSGEDSEEFPRRESEVRIAKKGRTFSVWIKSMFRLKKEHGS